MTLTALPVPTFLPAVNRPWALKPRLSASMERMSPDVALTSASAVPS